MEQAKFNYTRCVIRVILLRIQLSAAWMIAASTIIIIITIIQAPIWPNYKGLAPPSCYKGSQNWLTKDADASWLTTSPGTPQPLPATVCLVSSLLHPLLSKLDPGHCLSP